jgi:SWIM zinc finger
MAGMPIMPGFTEDDLRGQADSKSFERGRGYLSRVSGLDITDTGVTATVSGTDDYDVWLAPADQGLRWSCSCPFGQDGSFCKHCVAVGLTALAPGAGEQVTATRTRRGAVDAWLESLSREELAAELRGLLRDDRDLRRRFELRAAAASGDALSIRRATRALVTPKRGGYLAYDEADAYADDVYEVAAAIDRLAKAGGGAQAITAAREAIGELGRALERLDDSNGSVGGAAGELLAAHLRACQAEPPEPRSLARYLAGLVLDDPYGVTPDLSDYAGLLGPAGLAALRERITGAGAGTPPDRWVLEGLLRAEGNVDDLVALHAAHLDDLGRGHLAIARDLDAAGRGDEALAWAERGLREAGRPDGPLVEYLADRYAAAGRPGEVLALRRDRFAAGRTLRGYQQLRQAATAAGRWPDEREPALALLAADARVPRPRPPGTSADWTGPVLVDALLDEGENDAAWAAAQQVPEAVSPGQWLRLADLAAAARPADALAVYLRLIEPLRARTGEKVYEQVARLLRAARACHQALGTSAEFDRYLAWLREDQKRKPNLMLMLNRSGLAAAARGPGRAERLL